MSAKAKHARLALEVISYNVLCPHLCAQKDYPRCTADALDPEKRQARVWAEIESHIVKRRLICLQELARDWYTEMLPLLLANNYMIVPGLYGYESNGYMGVAVAYPTEKYELIEVITPRVADEAGWPPRDPDAAHEPQTAVDLARSRQNVMVLLRLRCKLVNSEFVLGTYHMPCMYDRPEVMQLHAAAAADQAQQFADGDPLVLAGDFNFAPDSPGYRIVTRGKCQRADERRTLSTFPALDKRHLRAREVMRSAYHVAHKQEPAFTAYSFTMWKGPNLFSGAIDYIFISKHFTHASATKLPESIASYATPLPTSDEPSDHLLVCAHLYAPVLHE